METIPQFLLGVFISLDCLHSTVAELCKFETSNGILQQKYCQETCCDGPDVRLSTVCCRYKRESEIYIGTGTAVLIVLTIFILCVTYICCKKQLLRLSRDSDSRNRNTRLSPRRNTVLPTVTEHVQPQMPPPYEILPPPYYTVERSDNLKKENTPSLSEEAAPSFPDGPPPAYSPYDTNAT